MKKTTLDREVANAKATIKSALQTVYDELNQGQQKKILRSDTIKELFDRYGVEY